MKEEKTVNDDIVKEDNNPTKKQKTGHTEEEKDEFGLSGKEPLVGIKLFQTTQKGIGGIVKQNVINTSSNFSKSKKKKKF